MPLGQVYLSSRQLAVERTAKLCPMSVLTTMWADSDPVWCERTVLVDRRCLSLPKYLYRIVRAAPYFDVVAIVGSLGARDLYRDLVAAILLKLRQRKPKVLVMDATWEKGSASLSALSGGRFSFARVAEAAIRALDGDHVHYAVLSTEEAATFASRWSVDPNRVHFIPFFYSLAEYTDAPITQGGYIFSGGDSLRDYQLLLEATAGFEVPVRVASHWRAPAVWDNVRIDAVSHEEFARLLLGSKMVVVPLRQAERSAGQQTYLNAMAVGKPVVVTDAAGVRDHVRDGVTGLVVPPTAQALRDAIEWILDPSNERDVEVMTDRARKEVRSRFSPAMYRRRVLSLCDQLALGS